MEVNPSKPSTGDPLAKARTRAATYFAALRVPVLLLCLFGVVLFAYYFLHVSRSRDYLTARNFRLLAKLGEQIDRTIENDRNVLIRLWKVLPTITYGGTEARNIARFVPLLGPSPIDPRRPSSDVDWVGHLSRGDHVTVTLKFVEQESRLEWVRLDDLATDSDRLVAIVSRELDDLLTPLLTEGIQRSIFDALLVATPDGRVIFQAGDPKLRITRLNQLQPADSKAADLTFRQLAQSSGTVNIQLSGARYELLMQPCCGRMELRKPADEDRKPSSAKASKTVSQKSTATGNSKSSSSEASKPEEVPETRNGWVLCALKAQQTMLAESTAVSFPVLVALTVVMLLGLLSWPFVKLLLIGEAQRVRVFDVVMVGFCALLGVALITALVLNLQAYSGLEDTLDQHLKRFASSIMEQTTKEVSSAYKQMTRLESASTKLSKTRPVEHCEVQSKCVADLASAEGLADGTLDDYPFFESLALLDDQGVQQRKLALGSFVTPLIGVGSREYFTHWNLDTSQPRAFLQPVRSFTTGKREVVLSKRAADKNFKVASLTIPLRALIDPVIVPGFGFAVIDRDGEVLFHSDPQHSLIENFFDESDRSRRLRALVAAKHEEWVDIRYWGDEHRVLVTPMRIGLDAGQDSEVGLVGQPWTLVTFYAKDLPRTVTSEWLVLILVLTLFYAGIYVVICLAGLLLRPKYRVPWLWPDPARSRTYLDLIPMLLMLSAALAVSIAVFTPGDLIRVACLVPFLAWVLAYAMLSPRLDGARLAATGALGLCLLIPLLAVVARAASIRVELTAWRWLVVTLLGGAVLWALSQGRRMLAHRPTILTPPVNVTYGVAACLLLLLIAALPAAAFFRAAYDLEMENFVKYGQLKIALARSAHARRMEEATETQISREAKADRIRKLRVARANDSGVYDAFFFCTGPVEQRPEGCAAPALRQANLSVEPSALPEMIEEHLPFYSESAVHLRELLHDRTADQSWSWQRDGRNLILRMAGADQPTLYASAKPTFLEWSAGGVLLEDLFWLALGALVIVGAAVWIVRFVIHKVFVVDVIEPLWSDSGESVSELLGPHLFLIGNEPAGQTLPATYCEIDLAQAPEPDAAEYDWFDEQIARLGQSPGLNVLILHFERRLQSRRFNERKLALVERITNVLNRTVVIISATPPGLFFTPLSTAPGSEASSADWPRRWANLLTRFVVIPVNPVASAPLATLPSTALFSNLATVGWREIVWRLNALGFALSTKFLEDERRDPLVGRFWKEILPYAWHPGRPALDLTQLLVEVGERAEAYYSDIWATCTPAEKVVLGQIAEEGFVNEKTKRTVRLLMARDLVRRQPQFALMTETFRRFVLSSSSQAEVDALEEQSSSTWDAIRWPFLTMLIAGVAFFFVTQREAFSTALGTLTAAATVVPAIVKIASMFGDRRSSA